ncbi:FtsK/SpoIIIE domain-containing protein [Streptococcus merionis]|uniref:FtsK/SpoIIIE domain-containing protein n=1 Tax=Streptococcus merionis TaxID=400065 RepID=UPI003517B21C
MKTLLTYRGIRIRPWLLHIRTIFYAFLCLPILVGLGFYVYHHQEQYIAGNLLWIIGTFLAFIITLILIRFFQLYLEERFLIFKKLQRLWVFSRYLLDYRYYYEKKGNKGKAKKKFPKIYLKQGRYDLLVYLEMQGNKFQDRFKKIGGDLETTFFMDFMERTYEEKFIIYKLAYSAFLNRIHARDVEYVEGKGIRLMKNLFWDMVNDPHLLVSGGTGGGKTVFLRSLLVAILKIGTATVFDPKRADFVSLADLDVLRNRVFYEAEDIVSGLENEVVIMNARYDFMREKAKELGHKELGNWAKYGLSPHFVIADEWNAFVNSLGFQLRERAESALTQLVLKGRQAGCYMIIAMQKPSADDLPTKIRSSMMFRVSVGRLDETAYGMMFGDENSSKEFRYVKYVGGKRVYGRGYAAVFGDVAQEFYSPLITKNFNFFDIFETYPRIENRFNPKESEGSIEVKYYSRQESVPILNEMLGQNCVKEHTVRKMFEAMVAKSYPFTLVDGKRVISYADLEFMKQVFEMRESTPLDYEEIVQLKMEA